MSEFKKVSFEGKAGEFFKIWIVNLFLSIITIGIYSPWAKVINTKYLYGNIKVDGHRLDYIANPIQILIGRVIAVFLLAIFFIISSEVTLYAFFLVVIFFLSPWIINRSMSFRMRMTTYRNVRFNFHGNYIETLLYFIVLPFLSIFTLYLALPAVLKKANQYIIDNTVFGDRKFKSNLNMQEFYSASLFLVVGSILAIAIFFGFYVNAPFILGAIMLILFYVAFLAATSSYWTTFIRNHTYNNSELLGVAKFKSEMKFSEFFEISSVNIFALIFSLGFAYPWVLVRTTRYLSSTLLVNANSKIDEVIDAIENNESAILDEVATAFDLEI